VSALFIEQRSLIRTECEPQVKRSIMGLLRTRGDSELFLYFKPSSRLRQSLTDSQPHQVGSGMHPKLPHQPSLMSIDRLDAAAELRCDLSPRHALADEPQYLFFAVRK
jgi:hypothetical protein